MRLVVIGTSTNRSTETRLLTEIVTELSVKHQIAVLSTDVEGIPKAGIVPCKDQDEIEKWVESLKPEMLLTFNSELVDPNFERVNVCIVLSQYSTHKLEKYDLICTPFYDIQKDLKSKGFYSVRTPLQANTKTFADLGLKRKYKSGMVSIDPISLANVDDECLVLTNGTESFDILEWSELLGKKITVLVEKDESTLLKFYNSIEVCHTIRPDDYSTLHALACGCKVVVRKFEKIDNIGPEHIGKFPWLKLAKDFKKYLGERDKWQKYQIIQL